MNYIAFDAFFNYIICVNMHNRSKKSPIYFKTNYRTEIKLVQNSMDYCLLQFDALKFFLGVHLHGGGSLSNFNFFNVTPKFFNDIVKFTSQIAWK